MVEFYCKFLKPTAKLFLSTHVSCARQLFTLSVIYGFYVLQDKASIEFSYKYEARLKLVIMYYRYRLKRKWDLIGIW